jgi:hypothetical protein
MVSGMAFSLTFQGERYSSYIWKRIKRLLFPTWLFLFVPYGLLFAQDTDANNAFIYNYILLGSPGYLWIVRLFLMIALVAPFLHLINKKVDSSHSFFALLAVVFCLYEFIRFLLMPHIPPGYSIDIKTVISVIPYSILFAFSLRILSLTPKQKIMMPLFFLTVFTVSMFILYFYRGNFIHTQELKHPPSTYYLSYALFVSLLLWVISDKLWVVIDGIWMLAPLVLFGAHNSFWIYLWHIPFLTLIQGNFLFVFPVITTTAFVIVFLQVYFVNNVILKRVTNNTLNKNLKIILTG